MTVRSTITVHCNVLPIGQSLFADTTHSGSDKNDKGILKNGAAYSWYREYVLRLVVSCEGILLRTLHCANVKEDELVCGPLITRSWRSGVECWEDAPGKSSAHVRERRPVRGQTRPPSRCRRGRPFAGS